MEVVVRVKYLLTLVLIWVTQRSMKAILMLQEAKVQTQLSASMQMDPYPANTVLFLTDKITALLGKGSTEHSKVCSFATGYTQ